MISKRTHEKPRRIYEVSGLLRIELMTSTSCSPKCTPRAEWLLCLPKLILLRNREHLLLALRPAKTGLEDTQRLKLRI